MRSMIIVLSGVIGIALFFGTVGYVVIQASDPLAADVEAILRTLRLTDSHGGFVLLVDGGPNYFAAGMGIAALSLLVAGFPAALVAIVLHWRYRHLRRTWSSAWSRVFWAGFVFQLSSGCCAALVLLLLFAAVGNPFLDIWGTVTAASLVFSTAALPCWQSLRVRVTADTRLLPV